MIEAINKFCRLTKEEKEEVIYIKRSPSLIKAQKKYYEKNKEKIIKRKTIYYEKNKDTILKMENYRPL